MKRICVYCGSKLGVREVHARAARELGEALLARGLGLVYGGAHCGLMGLVADTVLAGGGEVVGVIPRGLVALELAHQGLSRLEIVDGLHERKARMLALSDGLITLPGGFGSHDELFEALSWLQLGIHDLPVGLYNVEGYYDGLLTHLDRCRDEGFLRAEHRQMLIAGTDAAGLLDALERFQPPQRPSWQNDV